MDIQVNRQVHLEPREFSIDVTIPYELSYTEETASIPVGSPWYARSLRVGDEVVVPGGDGVPLLVRDCPPLDHLRGIRGCISFVTIREDPAGATTLRFTIQETTQEDTHRTYAPSRGAILEMLVHPGVGPMQAGTPVTLDHYPEMGEVVRPALEHERRFGRVLENVDAGSNLATILYDPD